MVLAQNCTSRYSPYYNGTCLNPANCEGALINNLCPGSLKCCIQETNGNSQQNFVTAAELTNVLGISSPRLTYIAKILTPPTSNPTCNQKSAYLSQLAHESSKFSDAEELGSTSYFDRYEYNTAKGQELGNTQPGDGIYHLR